MRFWGVVLAGISWWLALSADIGAGEGSPALGLILTVVLSVGLGVAAVLLIPIERIWVRWAVNLVVLSIPTIALLALITSWF